MEMKLTTRAGSDLRGLELIEERVLPAGIAGIAAGPGIVAHFDACAPSTLVGLWVNPATADAASVRALVGEAMESLAADATFDSADVEATSACRLTGWLARLELYRRTPLFDGIEDLLAAAASAAARELCDAGIHLEEQVAVDDLIVRSAPAALVGRDLAEELRAEDDRWSYPLADAEEPRFSVVWAHVGGTLAPRGRDFVGAVRVEREQTVVYDAPPRARGALIARVVGDDGAVIAHTVLTQRGDRWAAELGRPPGDARVEIVDSQLRPALDRETHATMVMRQCALVALYLERFGTDAVAETWWSRTEGGRPDAAEPLDLARPSLDASSSERA
jgi:hypothetical protein